MYKQFNLTMPTQGRGIYNITDEINKLVAQCEISIGLCHVFLLHTSASLILCENDDPQVQADLEAFMHRLVPDGDKLFKHIAEGPDDMPAHVRSILTTNFLHVPIKNNHLILGTWQGLYLWEHRIKPYQRKLVVTIQGE